MATHTREAAGTTEDHKARAGCELVPAQGEAAAGTAATSLGHLKPLKESGANPSASGRTQGRRPNADSAAAWPYGPGKSRSAPCPRPRRRL